RPLGGPPGRLFGGPVVPAGRTRLRGGVVPAGRTRRRVVRRERRLRDGDRPLRPRRLLHDRRPDDRQHEQHGDGPERQPEHPGHAHARLAARPVMPLPVRRERRLLRRPGPLRAARLRVPAARRRPVLRWWPALSWVRSRPRHSLPGIRPLVRRHTLTRIRPLPGMRSLVRIGPLPGVRTLTRRWPLPGVRRLPRMWPLSRMWSLTRMRSTGVRNLTRIRSGGVGVALTRVWVPLGLRPVVSGWRPR